MALDFTSDELPFAEWERLVRGLVAAERGSRWWVADAIVFAKSRYGDTYTAALKHTGRSVNTLRGWAWLARAVPPEHRVERLTWSAHRYLCETVLKPSERFAWLARARKEEWYGRELRRELRRHLAGAPAKFPSVEAGAAGPDVTCPHCGRSFNTGHAPLAVAA